MHSVSRYTAGGGVKASLEDPRGHEGLSSAGLHLCGYAADLLFILCAAAATLGYRFAKVWKACHKLEPYSQAAGACRCKLANSTGLSRALAATARFLCAFWLLSTSARLGCLLNHAAEVLPALLRQRTGCSRLWSSSIILATPLLSSTLQPVFEDVSS